MVEVMRVWIVSGGWDHEGTTVLRVFSTEEKARAFAEATSLWKDWIRYDFLLLESGEIDGPLDEASVVFDKSAHETQ